MRLGTKRLKLLHDEAPSKFAFKSILRLYTKNAARKEAAAVLVLALRDDIAG
jgi:hypothetical protein